jgi:carboxypeptidase T
VYFSPSSVILDSTKPCSDYYHGEHAFSEPETRNARWIVDNFTNIRFFIDLHSSGQDILYRWGDDEDQTTDPNMNFMNLAYNGTRGVNGSYKEYIPANDLATALFLATALHDSIKAVRGTDYIVEPAYSLYPTAGTSDDYFYSRHFVDASKPKILSYTLEWGDEFQPPYKEMRKIIGEITAGLLAFCLEIVRMTQAHRPP